MKTSKIITTIVIVLIIFLVIFITLKYLKDIPLFSGDSNVCDQDCGGGKRYRTVVCEDGKGKPIDDKYCSESKPSTEENCNEHLCDWQETGWGDCEESGFKYMQYKCPREPGEKYCGPKPDKKEKCIPLYSCDMGKCVLDNKEGNFKKSECEEKCKLYHCKPYTDKDGVKKDLCAAVEDKSVCSGFGGTENCFERQDCEKHCWPDIYACSDEGQCYNVDDVEKVPGGSDLYFNDKCYNRCIGSCRNPSKNFCANLSKKECADLNRDGSSEYVFDADTKCEPCKPDGSNCYNSDGVVGTPDARAFAVGQLSNPMGPNNVLQCSQKFNTTTGAWEPCVNDEKVACAEGTFGNYSIRKEGDKCLVNCGDSNKYIAADDGKGSVLCYRLAPGEAHDQDTGFYCNNRGGCECEASDGHADRMRTHGYDCKCSNRTIKVIPPWCTPSECRATTSCKNINDEAPITNGMMYCNSFPGGVKDDSNPAWAKCEADRCDLDDFHWYPIDRMPNNCQNPARLTDP